MFSFLQGFFLAVALVAVGFIRVFLFHQSDSYAEALAISLSLFLIVFFSVLIGVLLPLALQAMGLDPVNAAPSIQVIMDILGVFITCVVCSYLLE